MLFKKASFECTMQVKCFYAVVDKKKKSFSLVEVLPCTASSTKNQTTTTTCKCHHVLVLSENSSWYRVVYQGTQH